MLVEFLGWLERTAAGQFIADSTPAFAAVESIHLLGLATLGGAVITLDLAAAGVIFRRSELASLGRSLFPVFWAGLAAMAVSGVLLVASGPFKYLTNPLFGPKLLTLALAILAHVALYPIVLKRTPEARRAIIGAVALVSLTLWVVVAILGRWVGLI